MAGRKPDFGGFLSFVSTTTSPSFRLPPLMHPSDNPSLFDPRSRQPLGTAASIWAPQPQPSEATWPKTLDSFSRVAEREFDLKNRFQAETPAVRREDVFGPVPAARPKDVGAIGDGRKKNSPGFDDTVKGFLYMRI